MDFLSGIGCQTAVEKDNKNIRKNPKVTPEKILAAKDAKKIREERKENKENRDATRSQGY
jgi:hypothetical protein